MKRKLSLALALCVAFLGMPPAPLTAAQQSSQFGSISGLARDAAGKVVAATSVHLRNIATGQVVASVTSNAKGEFAFVNVAAATYVVEVVNAAGTIVSATAWITVNAGASVTGVNATRPGGVGGAEVSGGAAGGSFFTSTVGMILIAAAGAGVGVAVYQTRRSPSR